MVVRVLILLAAVTACYQPTVTSCQYACGVGSSCPDGQSCVSGFCVAPGDTCTGSSGVLERARDADRAFAPTGIYTGSITAPGSLTPTFKWSGVAGAVYYELDLDSTCSTPGMCQFQNGQIITPIDGTSYTPPEPLTVSTTPPVGQRYTWRLRACNSVGCSDWSAARYLNVGRLRDDLDGDGRSEIAIGCEMTPTVSIENFNPATQAVQSLVQCGPSHGETSFGTAIVVGDFNGDGFADFAVAGGISGTPGDVTVIIGGTANDCDESTIVAPSGVTSFGQELAGVGDLDGDGYDDLVVMSFMGAAPTLEVYFGAQIGIDKANPVAIPFAMTPLTNSLVLVAGMGDIDGDGYLDAAFSMGSGGNPLAVAIVPGNPARQFAATTMLTQPGALRFGEQITIFDLDGDGLAEVFVSAQDASENQIASVFAYHSSGSGLTQVGNFMSTVPDNSFGTAGLLPITEGSAVELAVADEGNPVTIINASFHATVTSALDPGNPDDDDFGQSLGGGDLQGSGFTTLAVGAPEAGISKQGAVFVCLPPTLDATSFKCTEFPDPHPENNDSFGQMVTP